MPRSSEAAVPAPNRRDAILKRVPERLRLPEIEIRDPRIAVRVVLGVLLAANLAAAVMALRPWGGSAEDLSRQLDALRTRYAQQQAALAHTKALAAKVEKARAEGDNFLGQYMLARRTAFSTIVSELDSAARDTGIRPKDRNYVVEPIEGSDSLGMMLISGNYEADYGKLTQFVNLLDRSPRFLVIDSMQASPQQSGNVLNVNLRLLVFVKEEPGGQQ
ncbi:MAG: hypothetical protein WD696_01660 [Bryobacteraceae bacterium]